MMRLIAEDLGHWELAEVRRFDAAWEAQASLQLRGGTRAALQAYDARGRVRGGHQRQAMTDAVALYVADLLMGRDSLLVAGTNDEAAELAAMVRAELARLGRVPERVEARLADGNGAGSGDLIRARENTPSVDAAGRPLTNRDTLRLEGVTLAAGGPVAIVRRQLPDGGWSRNFSVPLDYLARSAELAYAGNVYVSQGRTVDTSHVYVSPSLSREALYVAMTRGRSANTAHVVTGPSPAQDQEPMAQADPLAVLAEVLHRTGSATTATEAMREAQAFATHSGHLLAMWSAATRPGLYAAVDKAVQARLSDAEYGRYAAEPQRPVFQRQVLGAVLAGASLEDVVHAATAREMTGARSVSAVMHGRLVADGYGAGQPGTKAHTQPEKTKPGTQEGRLEPVTWAGRVPVGLSPETAELGQELGAALDTRGEELAQGQAERPEPWVLATIGPYPREGSPALQADWLARVGQAAVYREAAGITDPRTVLGPAPVAHPELAEGHAEAARLLEIETEERLMWAMDRVTLEATVAQYARVAVTAPAEVSAQLRAERLAEADARARAAELEAQGQAEVAAQASAKADGANVRVTELEGRAELYRAWQESTSAQRHRAELAQAELDRRGAHAPQVEGSEPEAAVSRAEDFPQVSTGTEAQAYSPGPSAEEPGPKVGCLNVEAVAGDLDVGVDRLPALDTTTVSPATSARMEELEARRAAQAEADADRLQRETMTQAALAAEATVKGPEAETPGRLGPRAGYAHARRF